MNGQWQLHNCNLGYAESMMLVTDDYPENLGINFTNELTIAQLKRSFDQLDRITIARLCKSKMDKSVEVGEIAQ